jgi:hypothetical protein
MRVNILCVDVRSVDTKILLNVRAISKKLFFFEIFKKSSEVNIRFRPEPEAYCVVVPPPPN